MLGNVTQELTPGSFEITEEDLAQAQPKVRALAIQRLEEYHSYVKKRVDEADAGMVAHDPRWVEIGIRILKEEAGLYRLAKPAPALEEEEDPEIVGVNRLALINAQLDELEAKKQATQAKETGTKAPEEGAQT